MAQVGRIEEIEVFLAAAEKGSLSAAARDLKLTPSAVSKQIARLEARLGVRLLNRTTRRLVLTPEGDRYCRACRQLVEDLDGLERGLARAAEAPAGDLRVTCSVPFGVHQVVPLVPEFLERYPGVRLTLSLSFEAGGRRG
ncbi:MAG TPA: LysR family transcriptional regulator [Polyangiaceae bacterium]|nr:LysR family transcriptional regulator [Polyangiaceae bacterium]